MSQRRTTTPLFELLDASKPIEPLPQHPKVPTTADAETAEADGLSASDKRAAHEPGSASTTTESTKAPVRPQREVQRRPRPAAATASGPRLLEGGYGRPALVGGLLILPVPFALIAVGILIVIGAAIWATAWQLGGDQARTQERAKFAALGGSGIVDPVGEPRGGGREMADDQPPPQPPVSRDTRRQAEAQDRTRAGQDRPAGGGVQADPRQSGLNYLRLATLDEPQAQAAVARLAAGGLDAFAVPLETARRGSNTSARHAVYLSQGFEGGRAFSQSRSARERLVTRAREIGERWVSEGGPTGFQEPFWDKYVP